MYFNPVGFDPFAFLNSDGFGGLSNAPGQLVGAAMNLGRGLGYVSPIQSTSQSALGGGAVDNGDGTFTLPASTAARVFFNLADLVPDAIYFPTCTVISGTGTVSLDVAASAVTNFSVAPGSVIQSTGYRPSGYDATFRFFDVRHVSGGPFVVRPNLSLRGSVGLISEAATQAVLANKPVLAAGGSPNFLAMSFDGSNDILNGAAPSAVPTGETYLFAGLTGSTVAPVQTLIARRSGSTSGDSLLRIEAGFPIFITNNAGFTQIAGGTIAANTPFCLSTTRAAASRILRLNGSQVASDTAAQVFNNTTALTIGGETGANFYNGAGTLEIYIPATCTAAELAILDRAGRVSCGLDLS